MATLSTSTTAASVKQLKCPTLSDVIESTVIHSLCPEHLFLFMGFRRGMAGLRKDLQNNPPSEEEERHLLTIFPSSFNLKMDENQWQKLDELIEHPFGVRYQHFYFDWVSYGTACCENCKHCSVFCDSNKRQSAYSLIRTKVLEEAESSRNG